MKNLGMKWKIIIPMGAILTALVIITTVSSTTRFNGYTRILFNERIEVASKGLKKFISERERDTWIAAVTAAGDTEIINAVAEGDYEKAGRLLRNSLALYHVDFFVISDIKGTVLTRTLNPALFGDTILSQTNVSEALNGNIITCFEECTYTTVSVRTGAPLYKAGGSLIGVISAGVQFDSNATLEELKEHYNAEFSVFYNNQRIATTIEINGERIIGSPLDPVMAERIYSTGEELYGNVNVLGENYDVFYMPVSNNQGEIFAIIAAGNSNAKFILERNNLQTNVIIIGISGLVASIIMLLFITSRIVRPVNRLAHLVSEVTRGNMGVDISKTGIAKDEVGLLTLDIYLLVDVIKLILKDLSYLTTDLNKFDSFDFQIDMIKYSGSYKEIIGGIKKLADSISTMRKTMAAMDHLDTMIYVTDLSYNLLYLNRSMMETYGVERESCLGEKCYKAIRNLDMPCENCQMKILLPERDKHPHIDYDNLYDKTSGMYIGGRAAIIRWVDDAQVFFNSVYDITVKIKYQEQLRGAMVAAEAASVAKSAFLANMSHEIRTPMNSIIGFSELALDNEVSSITREYLTMIKENASGLLQIINNILDISKVESGNIELEHIPFNIHELLNSCKNIILPRAVEKKIKLQLSAEPSISKKLLGDPTKLRQVLLNLLSNAVKFTDSGSVKVSVSAKSETQTRIILRFEVKDTGIGMTSEQIGKIFEPFMQADVSTTRKYGGTGLGMTITKNILQLMGSRLEIESEPGTGTSIGFEISFDTSDKKETSTEAVNAVREIDKPSFEGEILVCEDNQMNQRVIIEHLGKLGLKVEIAENGQEGIDRVRSRINKGMKPFNLIFMDIHMPVMDGVEATAKILELGTGTPIVAMTANIMMSDREHYKAAGMVDYLGKPFTSQELWRCLLKHLKPVSLTDDK